MSATIEKKSEPCLLNSPSLLTTEQDAAVNRLVEFDETLLVAGMGAGKTIVALTAIEELLDTVALHRVLVVCPKRVMTYVWATEADKWEHTRNLHVVCLDANVARRKQQLDALMTVDIVVCNFEKMVWLLEALGNRLTEVFDGILVDEVDRLKAVGNAVTKKLRKHLPKFHWRVGMTGTPVAEDLTGLFGQMLFVSAGGCLGRSQQHFLERHFVAYDHDKRDWQPRAGEAEKIIERVSPWVHVVPPYQHELPELHVEPVYVDLDDEAMMNYRYMAKHSVLGDVAAVNEAVVAGKLQQIASGFLYSEEEVISIHDAKWLAIDALLEEHRLESIMLIYNYDEQAYQYRKHPLVISPSVIERWCARALPSGVMRAHPKSCGHGLNLQGGGRRQVWCGPVWAANLWHQTIARLWRRGQDREVWIHVVVARDTIDEAIMARMQGKDAWHEMFMDHLIDVMATNQAAQLPDIDGRAHR